jgi:ABC-type nitrate/sulfonate/bicarbonate transport system substrate-binding protein
MGNILTNRATRRAVLGGVALGGAAYLNGRVSAEPARPVKIANASGSNGLTMQEVLKQQGFLEEFGLQPEVLNIGDGAKIAAGVIGGEVDVSMMSGFAQIFPAIQRGAKLKVLAGAGMLPWLAVFTSKLEIRTLKDLEGKTVGTGSVGALLHQMMMALLRKNNVEVDKVRFVNIGGSVDVFRAVVVGTVDAGLGELSIIDQQAEFKVRMVEHGNLAVELPEFTYQGTWTSDQMIQRKRDTIVRTMAAYAKLYRFVQSPDSKDSFVRAKKSLFPNGSEKEALTQWNFIQTYKPFAVDLVLNEERLNYLQRLNIELNSQTRVLPFDLIADMSLARDALALLK